MTLLVGQAFNRIWLPANQFITSGESAALIPCCTSFNSSASTIWRTDSAEHGFNCIRRERTHGREGPQVRGGGSLQGCSKMVDKTDAALLADSASRSAGQDSIAN
jgi:hypothetical protein